MIEFIHFDNDSTLTLKQSVAQTTIAKDLVSQLTQDAPQLVAQMHCGSNWLICEKPEVRASFVEACKLHSRLRSTLHGRIVRVSDVYLRRLLSER